MFLKKTPKNKGLYLAITESYYDKTKKSTRQKTIKGLGYLEDLRKQYPDPIAHFEQVIADMNQDKESNKEDSVPINPSATMELDEDSLKNVGYGILKALYKELQLDIFWRVKSRRRSFQYNAEEIFRLLVISRILYPASKKVTYEKRGKYFEQIDGFSLDDVYSCLDFIDEHNEALQKWLYEHSRKLVERDLSISYFDCTNYYFDIGRSDLDVFDENGNPVDKKGNKIEKKLRKRGPEKNHRPDPIVEMGLLMDRNGIPVAFDLFAGNESEKVHMRPIVNRLKNQYTAGRVIFVADRGLNTSDNIYYLNGDNKSDSNQRDGYVYGQSVRGADAEFKGWVLGGGYITEKFVDETGRKITFTHKSRIHPKTLHVNVANGKKKDVSVDQKQMVYYSEKYAQKQKRDREVMVARAKDMILHPQNYSKATHGGSASYVKNISFNRETGEIVDGQSLELDQAKIEEEAKYDGYYSIVTSELGMDDRELRKIYRGLARIEDTFKVSKSELEARPVYVWTNEHIRAHFTTCFTALVLIRLLETKLGNQYPVGQLLESLRNYKCVQIGRNRYQFVYYDKILAECGKAFELNLKQKYRSLIEIRRLLRY